jgi:putative heme-binding domain-containing protein
MKLQGKPASPSVLWQQARERLGAIAADAGENGNSKTVSEIDAILRRYTGAENEPVSASELQPESDSLEAWEPLVKGAGDADNGWRVFQASRCSECHAVRGRGSRVGPELTGLGQTQSREQVLQSILEPSRDVGPLYSAWQILTVDGRTLTGIKLNGGGVGGQYRYLAADGTEFSLGFDEIETQRPAAVSLMPTGLYRPMRVRDLRDLLEFLENTP